MADYSKHKIEALEGICVLCEHEQQAILAATEITCWCQALGAQAYLNIALSSYQGQTVVHVTATSLLHDLTPGYSTIHLSTTLGLDTINQPEHLDLEILLCLSRSPIAYCFPSIAELKAAVRVRHFAVDAARLTELTFDPDGFERPKDCWTYV
jgi:hypothetical protein